MADVDLVVLCLPDDAAREAVALASELGSKAPRILDASSAHRVAEGWTFGWPEMAPGQAEAIAKAQKVSNPGCYPTGGIALIRPLVDAGLMPADYPVTVNAVSRLFGRRQVDDREPTKPARRRCSRSTDLASSTSTCRAAGCTAS